MRVRFLCIYLFVCFFSAFSASIANSQSKNRTKKTQEVAPYPVKEERETPADYKSGSVVVRLTTNGNATVRLGLAPNSVSVVEFPSDDPVYLVIPGNEDLVTVDRRKCPGDDAVYGPEFDSEAGEKCRKDRRSDPLIVRPGKFFSYPTRKGQTVPTTNVTVQRVSGILVTFIFVPVSDISRNANHVVVTYNVEDVKNARQSVGLSANLLSNKQTKIKDSNGQGNGATLQNVPEGENKNSNDIKDDSTRNDDLVNAVSNEEKSNNQLEKATLQELKRVGSFSSSLKFSKPVHGLSLAVVPQDSHPSDVLIQVVAVRNTLGKPVRLLQDQPELFVDNRSEKAGSAVVSNKLPLLYIATTVGDDDVLLPGTIYYFAFAYEMPILGAKQTLRVSMAQTNAADEPVTADLLMAAR